MRTTIGDIRLMIIAELADVIDIGPRRRERILFIEHELDYVQIVDGDASTTASSRPGYNDHRLGVEKFVHVIDWDEEPLGFVDEFNDEAFQEWADTLIEKYRITHVVLCEPGNPGTVHIPVDEWREMGYPVAADETPDEMWPAGKEASFCDHCAVKVGGSSEDQSEEEKEEKRKWNEAWESLLSDAEKAMRRWAMTHSDFMYVKDVIEYPRATRPGIVHKDSGAVVIELLIVSPYPTEPDRERDIISVKWDLRPKGSYRRHVKERVISPEALRTVEPPANLETTLDMP